MIYSSINQKYAFNYFFVNQKDNAFLDYHLGSKSLKIKLFQSTGNDQTQTKIEPFQFLQKWLQNFENSLQTEWHPTFNFESFCSLAQDFGFQIFSPEAVKYFCLFLLPIKTGDFSQIKVLFWKDLKRNTSDLVNYKFLDFKNTKKTNHDTNEKNSGVNIIK